MSEAADDMLTKPLGVGARARRGRRAQQPLPLAAIGGGFCFLLLAGTIALTGDPRGGEPRATASIEIREPAPPPSAPRMAEAAATAPVKESETQSAVEVEQASGVDVVRPDGSAAPDAAVIIRVPDPSLAKLNPAPDPRLIERGRHGPLPRLGEGRLRPLDVYARPSEPGTGPRIAILVSGLGIGETATMGAIARLPAAVSLAFSPYGSDLERSTARAREAGHEILLQLPMEPFDYPDSDPGPQALLAGARPGENLDRAAWAMSRFSGYVGAVNFMGARLMSEAVPLEPILKDLAARGLGFVDDGIAPRYQSVSVAAKLKLPAARSEAVIDAVARPDAIDAALARLETLAKQKGLVLATASASPLTLERLSRWSRDLEARGVRLVPVSAVLRQAVPAAKVSSAAP